MLSFLFFFFGFLVWLPHNKLLFEKEPFLTTLHVTLLVGFPGRLAWMNLHRQSLSIEISLLILLPLSLFYGPYLIEQASSLPLLALIAVYFSFVVLILNYLALLLKSYNEYTQSVIKTLAHKDLVTKVIFLGYILIVLLSIFEITLRQLPWSTLQALNLLFIWLSVRCLVYGNNFFCKKIIPTARSFAYLKIFSACYGLLLIIFFLVVTTPIFIKISAIIIGALLCLYYFLNRLILE